MATTPEGRVKKKIKAVLDKHGSRVYSYMPVPSGYGATTVDYLGFCCGRGFAIEAKRPGKSPTARQLRTIEEIEASDTAVFVIDDDEGCNELDQWLEMTIRENN